MSPLALSVRFLQTQPDGKLLELARAGHERAFEALVQRYRRPLLGYCRRLSRSEASAEDALQQALMQAWIALSAGEGEIREVRAWLYRIVHNVAISNLRRPVHDQVHEDLSGDGNGADLEVERRLAIRNALAGLAALPELQRRVMLSTALEGQSHDEVATALGLSHGAVRGLIYRARATLRAAAAAVMPGPLISWAARQDVGVGGRPATIADAIAGGSAGVAGALLKGGAIVVTAGALAGAAGVALHPHSHRSHAPEPPAAGLRSTGAVLAKGGAPGHAPVNPATGASASAAAVRRAPRCRPVLLVPRFRRGTGGPEGRAAAWRAIGRIHGIVVLRFRVEVGGWPVATASERLVEWLRRLLWLAEHLRRIRLRRHERSGWQFGPDQRKQLRGNQRHGWNAVRRRWGGRCRRGDLVGWRRLIERRWLIKHRDLVERWRIRQLRRRILGSQLDERWSEPERIRLRTSEPRRSRG